MQLRDKVCLITGGTRGIGGATALAFAQAGATIAIAARRLDEVAHRTCAAVEKLGRKCLLISADLGQPEAAVRCVEETVSQLGSIDVLVHSAGGLVAGGLLDLKPADWYRAFDVHVHAIFHLCRAALPL